MANSAHFPKSAAKVSPKPHALPAPRAVVWLIDLWRGGFEEAQGGVGFGAVVVEAGVEALEGFRVMKP